MTVKGAFATAFVVLSTSPNVTASAQVPRINTFFPIGARSGTTVEVEIRGSAIEDAQKLLFHGKGISGKVMPGNAKPDETNKPIWETKCGGCHELRSPANRSMTPGQWAATIERMVKVRSAPLSPDEQSKVTQYLVSAARAGKVTASITVAPDALPGMYEVRVATARGISSPAWFEVGAFPELIATNAPKEQAPLITFPCVVHGCLTNTGERHYFKFTAKQGDRLVFNLKAFRYSEPSQFFFSPDLRLYDSSGKMIAENHGYFDIDPLIDWTCSADGGYTLEVRDLLGRPNPASVYRLILGKLPYNADLWPPAIQAGTKADLIIQGKLTEAVKQPISIEAPATPGLAGVATPAGPLTIYSSPYAVVRDDQPGGSAMAATPLPATFAGTILKPGETDSFNIQGNGTFEFEGYASRVGSPVSLSVALVKADGTGVASFGGDSRMAAKLEPGQNYQLKVANGSGEGGPAMVYAIEAHPAAPVIEVVVRPDNITIRPGVSTAAMVILNRKEGVEGDVYLTAEDLPEGVTVTPALIPPDRSVAWILFSAAPNAAMIEKSVRVIASARGTGGTVKMAAVPQEEFRLNNDPRYRNWSDLVVAVRGQSDFSVEFVDKAPIRIHPRKATPVKVRIKRRQGFTANVTVTLSGLPQGWVANAEATDKNELTLTVRPDGNDTAPFLKRDAKWSPILATLEAASDDFRFAFGVIEIKRVEVIKDDD